MTDDAQVATDTGDDTGDQEPKTFDADYVSKLRAEAASNRVKKNELQTELDKFKQEQKDAEEARLEEANKWKELADRRSAELEELSPYRDRYEIMLESVKAGNEDRIKTIPEQMRSLVPAYEDPVQLSTWLDQNVALLSKPIAPALNGDAGSKTRPGESGVLTPEELETARKMGLSAQQYQEAKR